MDRRTRFYLDKRNGKFLGVCAGAADYLGVDPIWIRLAFVVSVFTTGISLLLYFAVAMIADPMPRAFEQSDPDEKAFWRKVRVAPQRSIREVHSTFRDLDRRMADAERHYTAHNSRLADEIEQLRRQQ